jgi:seryl-tRNA synthetase
MSDFKDAEEIVAIYEKQTEKQIIDLNKIIVALRTKIDYLENKNKELQEELQKEKNEREKIPVPKSIIYQIVDLKNEVKKLNDDLTYYKSYIPSQVIINRENKNKPTRGGGLNANLSKDRVVEEKIVHKDNKIINITNKAEPTRKGGLK